MSLEMPRMNELECEGVYKPILVKIISFIRSKKLVWRGCLSFQAHFLDYLYVESVPVMKELNKVFLINFVSVPTEQNIDFFIDFDLDSHLIFISPY